MSNSQHKPYMLLALQLAELGRLSVSPNPMVGCVIVNNGQLVGQGFHQYAGGPHAEIIALKMAGHLAKNATLYVTLEPCCHHGRTAPCTDAIIAAGIKNVYVACPDPNTKVDGKGIEQLRAAGIYVKVGMCETEALKLNEIFMYYMTHQRPFVISKWAMSLDGKTSVNANDDKQISGAELHDHTHQLRQQIDAILVGANTARTDNPKLTAKDLPTQHLASKQPIRIVLAGKQPLSQDLQLFNGDLPGVTMIACTAQTAASSPFLLSPHVEMLILPEDEEGNPCLHALLDKLGEKEITSMLVEGGMTVHERFLKENLVNKLHVYIAPVLIGSSDKKMPVSIQHLFSLDRDFHFVAHMKENKNV